MIRNHLQEIRAKTSYPAFRGVVGFASLAGYLLFAALPFTGLAAETPMAVLFLLPVALAGILAVRVAKEMSLMLADVADTLVITSEGYGSAMNVSKGAPAAAPSEAQQAYANAETSDQQMAKYGISYDGEKYCFKQYRYDRLADAITYAELQARK